MNRFHSQCSSPVHQGMDHLFRWQCTPDRMFELGTAAIQDQACKDAEASLQSSISSLDNVMHDMNGR